MVVTLNSKREGDIAHAMIEHKKTVTIDPARIGDHLITQPGIELPSDDLAEGLTARTSTIRLPPIGAPVHTPTAMR